MAGVGIACYFARTGAGGRGAALGAVFRVYSRGDVLGLPLGLFSSPPPPAGLSAYRLLTRAALFVKKHRRQFNESAVGHSPILIQ